MKARESTVKFFEGVPYRVIYRKVKFPRLEFRSGVLDLILPLGGKADSLLNKKREWIHNKFNLIQEALKKRGQISIKSRTYEEFCVLLDDFVREAENEFGVKINRVLIRKMRTKWASCSSKGNITINRDAIFLPNYLLRYLVYHEVSHRLVRRHDSHFWRLLSSKFPDYEKLEKDLFAYWFLIRENQG
jgi:hypothetical protein